MEASVNAVAGRRAVEVMSELKGLQNTSAGVFKAVVAALRSDGFDVTPNYWVGEYAPGHQGSVNILAKKDSGLVAIQLDDKRPTRSTVAKLKKVSAYRIVGLRGAWLRDRVAFTRWWSWTSGDALLSGFMERALVRPSLAL